MRGLFLLCVAALTSGPFLQAAEPDTAAVQIGGIVENLQFKDRLFLERGLDDFEKAEAIVIVASNTSCPIVQKYWPKLVRLNDEYASKGVQFVSMNVMHSDSISDMSAQAIKFNVPFPVVKDIDGMGVAQLGFTRTPEVVVLDADHRLVYRGRIDDQHRVGATTPAVRKDSLKNAINSVLAGNAPNPAETSVDGCLITAPPVIEGDAALTWADHIQPLFKSHCADCHKPGTEAPFALEVYDDVTGQADMIAEVVADQRMPPWYGAAEYKDFINHRGMSTDERHMVQAWIKGGMTRGTQTTETVSREPVKIGWQLGQPDKIITTTENHQLPADGYVDYKYSILPYVFTEETWVRSIEILPENPNVVHHANLFAFPKDKGINAAWFITGKVPGSGALQLKDEVAVRIPKGTVLALQIHFTTTGQPEQSRLSLGLHYAGGTVNKSFQHILVRNQEFSIPPGDPYHPVVDSETLEHDVTAIGLFSHMHVRGRDMSYKVHYPDNTTEDLLVIPNYSFDWQMGYEWAEGTRKFPKGTRLECVAHFDNSEFNPFNPDATDTVHDGPQTYHEMMMAFMFYTIDSENLNLNVDPKTGVAVKSVADASP